MAKKVHPLDGMLALAVCTLFCGCRSLYASSHWGRECELEIRAERGLLGDREEHRTLEASTEVVPYRDQGERLDQEEGEAGTIARWPTLAQICRLQREVVCQRAMCRRNQ